MRKSKSFEISQVICFPWDKPLPVFLSFTLRVIMDSIKSKIPTELCFEVLRYTYESYLDYRNIIDWNWPNTIVFQTSSNKCTDKLSANFSLLSVMIISYWLFMNKLYLNNYGSSHWKCSMKKAVLNTFTNSLEKTWPFEFFFKKIKTVLERRLQHRCFTVCFAKKPPP